MPMNGRVVALAAALWGASALADPNDFQIYRLGNPTPDAANYRSDANVNFARFVRELGAALTSVNLMPPETLGHAAFSINAELSVVQLKTSQFLMPTEGAAPGTLLIPSVHLRKGLPFSFEMGARAAWIEKSRMGSATAELKWALNEGFSYLPDLGIRGYATRLFNTRDFDLTALGADLGVGHQFAIGGMITLTPYVGWNLNSIAANSNNVDFNPQRSNEEALRSSTAQMQDTASFEGTPLFSNSQTRFYGGLRFVGGAVQLAAEFSYTTLGTVKDSATGESSAMPPVVATNWTLGLDF
jgi:hypothetical protein